ncbi:MAG: ABC transporter ATP-binding protein [Pseudomonadota bacterium]|jgi:ABC-2 type transport system ATP-binding protein
MPVALKFENVSKSYADTRALRGLTLEVASGELFGLVGVNGAGKTTLIKCLLDFCAPEGGNIEIFGVSYRLHQSRRRLAFVPERFAPPSFLTGRDFLKYMLRLRSMNFDEDEAGRALAALDFDFAALGKPVHAYSKGMAQKLGLAACFLSRRDLYVLDEPTSGLDPKARALLKRQLQALKAEGRTVFFSSHALADVEEICDRMAILHQGELRYAGTPADCRRHYQGGNLEQAFLRCIG